MKDKKLNVQIKSILLSIIILFTLMVVAYILTFIIPHGAYERVLDESGNLVIVNGSYTRVDSSFPFYKFILAPFLIFGSSDSFTILKIMAFILIILGSMNVTTESGILKYFIKKMVYLFKDKRYLVLFVVSTIFVLMGALIGCFEEIIPFVPIMVSLALSLGFDTFVGLSISMLSIGAGWSTGLLNAYTTGISQEMLGLQLFSGTWFRLICFVFIYAFLELFIYFYAKRHAKELNEESINSFEKDENLEKGAKVFGILLGSGLLLVVICSFISFLAAYGIIFEIFVFLFACIISAVMSKMSGKAILKAFGVGILTSLPSVFMIMLASSVKYILAESNTLDTILYYLTEACNNLSPLVIILLVYLIVLILNFFIASGSAKVFLIMPLLAPIAMQTGLSLQLVVVAYCFGDGFSNLFYPTNPVLLIGLGSSNYSYGEYVKKSFIYQFGILVITILLLVFGYYIGY